MQCVGVQVINSEGVLERVIGTQIEITDRKELEDTLVANDSRLQDLSGGGPLAAFELDFANLVFWFSPAFERLLGFQDGELAPHPSSFASILPDEDAPMGTESWLLTLAPGQNVFTQLVKLRAKDGRAVSVVLGALRTLSRKRELVRVVGFVCPLPPEATLAPDALPAVLVNETFTALAEAVLISDSRGKVIFANTTAVRLLQIDPLAVRGQSISEVFRLVNRQSHQPGDDASRSGADRHTAAPLDRQRRARNNLWTAAAAHRVDRPGGVR
jgi:PAS domain-containing protein